MNARDYERAIPAFEQLLEQKADDIGSLDALGFLYFMTGRVEDARRCCERSIELAPGNYYAHKGLGLCLARLGDPEAGIVALERSVEIKPDYFDSRHDLALVLIEQGLIERAREHLERAIAIDPSREPQVRQLLRRIGAD